MSGRGSGPTRRSNDQPTTGDPAAPPLPREAPEQKEPNRLLTDTGESSEHPAHQATSPMNTILTTRQPSRELTHRETTTRTPDSQRRQLHHLRPQQRPYIIPRNTGKSPVLTSRPLPRAAVTERAPLRPPQAGHGGAALEATGGGATHPKQRLIPAPTRTPSPGLHQTRPRLSARPITTQRTVPTTPQIDVYYLSLTPCLYI